MKRWIDRSLVGLLVVGLFVLGSAAAAIDVNAAYVSKYIWRGQDQISGQPALQPGVTIPLGPLPLSVGLWASYNLGTVSKQEITEVDYTLTYTGALGDDWGYSVYYSIYNYPPITGSGAKSGELFLNLTANKWLFTPTLLYAYDNDQGKGAYVSLNGKQSFNVGQLAIDGALTAGYDGGQFGATPGFSDATLAFSSAIPAGTATITPTVNYTVVGKDTRPTAENTFWFSLNVASSI
jgi:uncharacterized protein (TIGR02001 family)